MITSKRNETIDVLKGITIIMVIFGHACQVVGGGYPIHSFSNSDYTNATFYVSKWLLCFL